MTSLTALDLAGNQLTVLPTEVGGLTALKGLNLTGNRLAALPPEVGQLIGLTDLSVSGNQLTALPSEVGRLTALTALDLRHNWLAALPPTVGRLTALTSLDLRHNRLTTLPPEIGRLTALTALHLGHNRLAALPPTVGRLADLMTLDLSVNQLAALPPEIAKCDRLVALYLHGNNRLVIPESLLGPTWLDVVNRQGEVMPARPGDILNFYLSRQASSAAGTLKSVGELKAMLVGRGGAGKTSLRRFFLNQPHDINEPETPGIALDDFRLDSHGGTVIVHLWDFAGQEITHALHQFFLTEGCVYILVLDPRSNTEMTDAIYWLDQLKRYAPSSPVIVTLNRQDSRVGGYDVDRDWLMEKYPQIKSFVPTNCQTRSGCSDLLNSLIQAIEELDPNEPPRLEVPAEWLAVKDECWKMSSRRPSAAKVPRSGMIGSVFRALAGTTGPSIQAKHKLTFEEFREISARHGCHDRGKQESLARLLHKLGAVLHFAEDRRLRDTAVLNPLWVTDGVYRLLRAKDRPGSDGILTLAEASWALSDRSETSARYLLSLMERFEMCFPLDEDAVEPTRWLVPGALDAYQPAGIGEQWKARGAVRIRYDYGAPVAEGAIPRFIVLTHPLRGEAVWRNGVMLRDGAAAALVRRSERSNYIEVAALGPPSARLRMLELVQGTMARVNAGLPGRPPVIEQELEGLPGVYKAQSELRAAELAKTPVVVASPDQREALVLATPQLNRVSEVASRDPARVPLRAFLSYSQLDRRAKSLFAMNLNVMQGKNLITTWHDGMIAAGTAWRTQIDEQLDSMDLFLGLVTTGFLESEFIEQVELKAARARLRERKKRDFLFALILVEDVSLHGLDVAQYQLVVPAGKPVCRHKSLRDGFNQAQKVIEELIAQHRKAGGAVDHVMDHLRHRQAAESTAVAAGVTYIVQRDYVEGTKQGTVDQSIYIGGDVVRSQVGQSRAHCANLVQQLAPGERRDLLEQLQRDVETLIRQLPADTKEEAPQVAENLEMLVKQATSDKPNRKWYSVSAEGLIEASKFVKDFSGNILGTVGQLGKLIWPDFTPPKGD